ncbi:cysteine desulfurase [Thermosporothrix hazakensis]|jgi:cysteine desulfurase|uniref:cysteine desulfurase n=1 Tax=Thermosporothrix hazakensis TaxID=644383 RepID=A0A326U010_THEHA|nr:cysteine desulfurase family protein [Thermosporothrix hazakensis]PZW22478.1 cysteine desulfurase [Thermosporothrix hazakensis]GCE45535.1 cysteine desulfurase [Thermosporothrix hazakensis]
MTHPALDQNPIYLDYNATTPIDPAVLDGMTQYLSAHFGNPSSTHFYGRAPRAAIATARERVAHLLDSTPEEIIFTGSGSESNTLALRGTALMYRDRGNHIITQQTEHPAVLEACRSLERLHQFRVTYLPVDHYGQVSPAALEAALTPDTVLVSIMYANNETGTIQPISALASIAHRHGVLFHTDASQAVGKVPVRVSELGVDLLTIAGHKLYAPKGIGALYIRRGLDLEPSIYGASQEQGRRAGTENVAFMVALGIACLLAQKHLGSPRLQELRDLLQQRLEHLLPGLVHLNGHPSERLPNTLNVSIDGTIGEQVLAATPEIAASTGSACHEGMAEPSEVLLAMGLSQQRAMAALRLSLGRWTTEEEVEQAARAIARSALALRE